MPNLHNLQSPGGPGVFEQQLARNSGLRWGNSAGLSSLGTQYCITKNAATAVTTAWQTVAINKGNRLPIPATPCVIISMNPILGIPFPTETYSVRLTGFNQFGMAIVDELPSVTLTGSAPADRVNQVFIWASKVFAQVTKIEVKLAAFGGGVDVTCGLFFTWDETLLVHTTTASAPGSIDQQTFVYNKNQGIGLPKPISPQFRQDLLTLQDVQSFTVKTLSAALTDALWVELRARRTPAAADMGGYILGQFRGAAQSAGGVDNVVYTNVPGDLYKLRIERNSTDTILAADDATGLTFYTSSTTAAVAPRLVEYDLNVFSSVGSRVGGLTGQTPIPA